MHIVHIYDGHEEVYNGNGSVPDVVWNLARHTANSDHQVTIIERKWNGLPSHSSHNGVQIRRVDLGTGADEPWERIPYELVNSPLQLIRLIMDRTNFALKTLSVLRQLDYDSIHVHLPFAANVLASLYPKLRRSMVYTAHIGETEQRVVNPTFSPDVYLAKRVSRAICLNPRMKSAFVDRGVPEQNISIIPNGVNVDRFNISDQNNMVNVRDKYNIDDEKLVLFVGTVTPRKGVLDLIQAAARVKKTTKEDVHFMIVGKTDLEPQYVDELKDVIQKNELTNTVTLTGFIPKEDVNSLYACADLFVLPSYQEGSSVAISEAIAAGLPIVASNISGNNQQIIDGVHGYLFEPGNSDALASNIKKIIENDQQYSRFEENVHELSDDVSWNEITKRYIDVYRGL